MLRVLFVSNGHGETAIAARIGRDVASLEIANTRLELLAVVGTGAGSAPLELVGPRRAMPSGGLVAMGNVRAFSRDVRAGFFGLLRAQLAFLRAARSRYDVVVAVGDVYALGLAFVTGLPAIFVGTAKSEYVASYGRFERLLLRRAVRIFVRDEMTATRLRERRVAAIAPGNVIVDLAEPNSSAPAARWIGLVPGSRDDAYDNAVRSARVLRAIGAREPELGGLLSLAPTLDPRRFMTALEADGWTITEGSSHIAFAAAAGPARIAAWSGDFGAILGRAALIIGAAGTANEQAAARGVPIVVLDDPTAAQWYRMRQRRLLGEALILVPSDPAVAAEAVLALLADETRLQAMAAVGRSRMGPPGGSAIIARAIADFAA